MVPKIFIYSSDERLVSLKWVAALPIQSLEDVWNFQISEQSPVNCLLIRQIGSDLLKNAPIRDIRNKARQIVHRYAVAAQHIL
jgi:hypothetical protein